MFEYMKGQLTKIRTNALVLEVSGIGYLIHVANPYAYSGQVNQELTLYLYQAVREDAHTLYGFRDEAEKELFLHLISVSGIGPTSALAIIAADDHEGLVQAISEKNSTYLTKFPKIGKKTAQQMILDLEGKLQASESQPLKTTVAAANQALDEAMEALQALGYKAAELKKIRKFFDGTTDTAENYMKSALKMLVK
ncbi:MULTISPECIES: Holliday junction branch migration protein RuvA [unclassified Streptococcus]|uniref:Holliday junction branch migration protein RuvA n=1 Tax=unclassified Streptococcus TaxID=2608887 RepID=UPI001071FFF4|nr:MULTISPECIES: Holliday junction branch migration protein RuvA [unclassified Streptococcus]MBF0805482.1 Holliday junction branch migration protein RuvA [Streptococcus sp. 19428wA2_WM07]TFU29018.1 Holliday junction branch migration protein RuvA [Streptococcus sp. WM07]